MAAKREMDVAKCGIRHKTERGAVAKLTNLGGVGLTIRQAAASRNASFHWGLMRFGRFPRKTHILASRLLLKHTVRNETLVANLTKEPHPAQHTLSSSVAGLVGGFTKTVGQPGHLSELKPTFTFKTSTW